MEDNHEDNHEDNRQLPEGEGNGINHIGAIKATVRFILKVIACCIVIYIVYLVVFYRAPKHERGDRRMYECAGNIRVILGAIEMFSLNNSDRITSLNDKSWQMLLDGKYLKSMPKQPTPNCKYECYDKDYSTVVYCVHHGEHDTHMINGQPSPYLAEQISNNESGTIVAIAIPIILVIAAIWAFK